MAFPQPRRTHVAGAVLLTLTPASTALASQGPGSGAGTASPAMQLVVGIVVYGGVALIAGGALMRVLKQRLF
jgi:hypothetical protein